MTEYARRHGMSAHTLYEAIKQMKRLGLLPAEAVRPRRVKSGVQPPVSKPAKGPSAFAAVKVVVPPEQRVQVELPNGVKLSWSGADATGLLTALGKL